MILACPFGACRFVEGNHRAAKRVAYAGKWLEQLGIDPTRARFTAVDPEQARDISGLIKDFVAGVAELGPVMGPDAPATGGE